MEPHPARRRRLSALSVPPLVLFAASILGACGSGDEGSAAASDAAGAVSIEHAHGTTTVDEPPQRIVTLGGQWTDAVLAMGVQPVAYADDPLAGADGRYPWNDQLDAEAVGLKVTDGVPVEKIAELRPDLILVVPHLVESQVAFDALSEVAPTISSFASEHVVDDWTRQVEVVGDVLGQPDRAQEVIDDVERLVADTASELPGLAGKTFALANFVPGDALYVVADPADGSTRFFEQLGMELSPDLLAAADGVSGRVQLSLEQVDLLTSDLLVLFTNDGQASDLIGFDRLPAVVSGAAAVIDYVAVVGLNTPSALSIPYSLEAVRPALAAAAGI